MTSRPHHRRQRPPGSRLDELEAELARRDAQPGTYTDADVQNALKALQAPQHPQAPSARWRHVHERGCRARPRSLQGPQAPPEEEPITAERRFLDLPSVQQLPLEERTQRFKEFYGLRPALKEEFLRSEEPPSDLAIDIEKPSTPQPGAVPAPPTGPASSTRIDPSSQAPQSSPWRK